MMQVTDKMAGLERDTKWKCGAGHKVFLLSPSVVCESCLIGVVPFEMCWLNYCSKKTFWFCQGTR